MGVTRQAGGTRLAAFSAADRFVLRLALGATLGFAAAMLLDWQFTFLVPLLAMQLLAAMPVAPSLRQGLGVPLVIFVSTTAALALATLLADAPMELLAVVGLVVFGSFYARRRGAPAIVMLLVQIAFCAVPLLATNALDLAGAFVDFLQRSSLAAVAIVWVSHALIPAPRPPPGAQAPPPLAGLPPAYAARVALSDALVLLPLLGNFMLGAEVNNFVILMMSINLLGALEPGGSHRIAIGLLAGNVLGGTLALFAQQFVQVADNFFHFLLTVLLAGLWFASRAARGGPMAPVFVMAFGTFILLLGIAIAPVPGGSEEAFWIRILKIGAASAYAIGALSLLSPLRRPPAG